MSGCEKRLEVSGESGLPVQGVGKVLARALSTGLFFQCGTVRILLRSSFSHIVPH